MLAFIDNSIWFQILWWIGCSIFEKVQIINLSICNLKARENPWCVWGVGTELQWSIVRSSHIQRESVWHASQSPPIIQNSNYISCPVEPKPSGKNKNTLSIPFMRLRLCAPSGISDILVLKEIKNQEVIHPCQPRLSRIFRSSYLVLIVCLSMYPTLNLSINKYLLSTDSAWHYFKH
jgi:hypothetical protein